MNAIACMLQLAQDFNSNPLVVVYDCNDFLQWFTLGSNNNESVSLFLRFVTSHSPSVVSLSLSPSFSFFALAL